MHTCYRHKPSFSLFCIWQVVPLLTSDATTTRTLPTGKRSSTKNSLSARRENSAGVASTTPGLVWTLVKSKPWWWTHATRWRSVQWPKQLAPAGPQNSSAWLDAPTYCPLIIWTSLKVTLLISHTFTTLTWHTANGFCRIISLFCSFGSHGNVSCQLSRVLLGSVRRKSFIRDLLLNCWNICPPVWAMTR